MSSINKDWNILLMIEGNNSLDGEDNSRHRTNMIIDRQSNFPRVVINGILNFEQ